VTLVQRVLLAPDDGSAGPLLRIAEDRLGPGEGYGRHEHRRVDVVAVVLAGELRHSWGPGARMAAGDVAVLRAGTGLEHDETAGDDGARVLQTYLRSAAPHAHPAHAVVTAPHGWVDLERADALLWVARLAPGSTVSAPAGLRIDAGPDDVVLAERPPEDVRATEPTTVLVWQLQTTRPAWAADLPRVRAIMAPRPPFRAPTRSRRHDRGGRATAPWVRLGSCRPAPPTCSPPPTPTPTAPSTCAGGCTGSPRSGFSCRAPRPPCSRRSKGCPWR
jgi:quercetin 2,3-dioxygenase